MVFTSSGAHFTMCSRYQNFQKAFPQSWNQKILGQVTYLIKFHQGAHKI